MDKFGVKVGEAKREESERNLASFPGLPSSRRGKAWEIYPCVMTSVRQIDGGRCLIGVTLSVAKGWERG